MCGPEPGGISGHSKGGNGMTSCLDCSSFECCADNEERSLKLVSKWLERTWALEEDRAVEMAAGIEALKDGRKPLWCYEVQDV